MTPTSGTSTAKGSRKRELIGDTETTGLHATKGDRLVEVAFIETIDGVRTGNSFHRYIDPQRSVPAPVVKIHGLTSQFLAGKPKFRDIAADMLSFLGDDSVVFHNAPFDVGFIDMELQRAGFPPLANPIIDTMPLCRVAKPGGRHNLDAMCKHFGIDLSKRTLHGALLDAELLSDVRLALQGGTQRGLELVQAVAGGKQSLDTDYSWRTPPRSRLTETAKQVHAQFIREAIGSAALWFDP